MKKFKLYTYLVPLLILFISIFFSWQWYFSDTQKEIREVNKINKELGTVQLEEEFLGPNYPFPVNIPDSITN